MDNIDSALDVAEIGAYPMVEVTVIRFELNQNRKLSTIFKP